MAKFISGNVTKEVNQIKVLEMVAVAAIQRALDNNGTTVEVGDLPARLVAQYGFEWMWDELVSMIKTRIKAHDTFFGFDMSTSTFDTGNLNGWCYVLYPTVAGQQRKAA